MSNLAGVVTTTTTTWGHLIYYLSPHHSDDDNIIGCAPCHGIYGSQMREVPDNQEVFVDTTGGSDVSLIVELLEYRPDIGDGGYAQFLFQDLAEHNEASNVTIELEADLSQAAAAPLIDR